MSKTLILGGIKSGKSRLAEERAKRSGRNVIYVATATAGDSAMQKRIERHQQDRPAEWGLIEEPIKLAEVLKKHASADSCILVDCLTLWLTNLLMQDETTLQNETTDLLEQLSISPGEIIMVSNETSMGIIPMGELTRRFCDEAGVMHQKIAQLSDNVILSVAGLPHLLKGSAH